MNHSITYTIFQNNVPLAVGKPGKPGRHGSHYTPY